MAACGASCPLRVAPAKVPWPNRQPTLGPVGGNWSKCPFPTIGPRHPDRRRTEHAAIPIGRPTPRSATIELFQAALHTYC